MDNTAPNTPGPAHILRLTGRDARAFAQAQLASRIDHLQPGHWQWTAWLRANGRVRMLGMAWLEGDQLALLLRGGDATRFRDELKPFVLRAQVHIEALQKPLMRLHQPCPAGQMLVADDHLDLGLGRYRLRLGGPSDATAQAPAPEAARAAITAGHPWLPEAALDRFLPPALALPALGATTLGKGCYPGQEMVNRLHHRGGHKWQLAHVQSEMPWQPGDALTQAGVEVGMVLQRSGEDALLVLRQDAEPAQLNLSVVQWFPATAAGAAEKIGSGQP